MKKIDFESHFYTQYFLDAVADRKDYPIFDTNSRSMIHSPDGKLPIVPIIPALLDLGEGRLRDMDEAGVDKQLLSISVGIEQMEPEKGVPMARECHDILQEAIAAHPDRFGGYAVLAVDDIDASVKELERVRKDYGFVGWNSFSNYHGLHLDDERFFPLLKKAVDLGMFAYVHPTFPETPDLQGYGPGMASSGFGFAVDVATCVTRMIFAGVFDRLPELKIIIGHCGEALPFLIQRMDDANDRIRQIVPGGSVNKKAPREYFESNIWITTSGNFHMPAFQCAADTFGFDHLLFGSDYPMEKLKRSVDFVMSQPISAANTEKIFSGNAAKYFDIQ